MTPEEKKQYMAEWRKTHTEERRQYRAEWHKAHTEEQRQYRAEYRRAHAEEIRQQKAEWYKANAVERRQKHREWSKTPKGRLIAVEAQARRRGGPGAVKVTAQDLELIQASQLDKAGNLVCYWCHEVILPDETPHLDHWMPLSKGGRHEVANLHYMHARCNLFKSDKLPPIKSDKNEVKR